MVMREIAALVQHYLAEWDSTGWADAYHSLVELGPRTLPEIESYFVESGEPRFRAALVQLARRMHSAEALSLFSRALRDEAPLVWKEALDGLVDLASPASISLLEAALLETPRGRTEVAEWTSWLEEALQQARASLEARGGAA